jgi:hypothetical protein
MRQYFLAFAAAAVAVTAIATSPAQASYHLIRWQDSGFCQVWDENIPTTPFPSNYSTVTGSVPTFLDALAAKNNLLQRGTCSF